MSDATLYDNALEIMQRNEMLYDRWENQIAAYMRSRWPEAFEATCEVTGSDHVTAMEVADMGADSIADQKEFLSDFYEVFRTLAKGCQLKHYGTWG